MNILYPLNTNQLKTFMIGSACESVGVDRNIICTSLDSRNIVGNHIRIGNPGLNKDIFSPSHDTTSNLLICTGNIEPFDTHVHGFATQERNLNLLCIEEVGVKIILSESVKEFDPRVQVNLTNSVLNESPKSRTVWS